MYKWDVWKEQVHTKWRTHWFSQHPASVAEYSWNYLFTGGKEIRPKLFCELWHYLEPDTPVNTELAFAIECIHVASTILDDTPWMDNASLRRGRPTLHTVFSPKKALLVTSELLDMVRTMWAANCPPHVPTIVWHHLLRSALQRLLMGQYYDMEKKGTLLDLASLKTGVLFELVAETVAVCIKLDTEYWKRWGNHLGILFQWMDDWQDQEEDNAQGNRNSFNEDAQTTLEQYSAIWSHIEAGIGTQWFQTQFGHFMRTYFTQSLLSLLPVPQETNDTLSSKTSISSPVVSLLLPSAAEPMFRYRLPSFLPPNLTAKEILHRLLYLSPQLFQIPSLRTNLWDIEESRWESVDELQTLYETYFNSTKNTDL